MMLRTHGEGSPASHATRGTIAACLTVVLVFLTACSPLVNFTPERAAGQAALEENLPEFLVDAGSIHILHSQAWGQSRLVLVSFLGLRRKNQVNTCLFIYEVVKGSLGWVAGNGGGCTPPENNKDPLDVFGGSHGQDSRFTSYTYGWINQGEITAAEVTWEDGETQQVSAVNRTYLAIRDGNHRYNTVKGLDTTGQILFTAEPTP
jgi:hypothetical protein